MAGTLASYMSGTHCVAVKPIRVPTSILSVLNYSCRSHEGRLEVSSQHMNRTKLIRDRYKSADARGDKSLVGIYELNGEERENSKIDM